LEPTDTPKGTGWKLALSFWAIVLTLTVLHTSTFRITREQEERLTGTKRANIELAYKLQDRGIFSEARAEREGRSASAYRPPAYPAFLALGMLATLDIHGPYRVSITNNASHFLRPLYPIQKIVLLVTAYLAMYAVWRTTRNRWLCLLPFPFICHTPLFLVDYRPILSTYTNFFYPTTFAALVVTALGLSLWVAFEKRRTWQFALSGLLAGVLALTRAAFLYYIVLGALVLFLWLWRRPEQRRVFAPRAACCVAVALVVVAGWMARNHHHFGRWFIAERGGYQLNVRAQMLDMDRTAYLASFLYWSNSSFLAETLLPRLIDAERLREIEGKLDPDAWGSYKKLAKQEWFDYQDRYGNSIEADRALMRDSLVAIGRRPIRHLVVSIPLMHRGFCVERFYGMNWLLIPAFFGVAGLAFMRGSSSQMAMLSPALFCFAFNVAATNSLPRYNILLIPLLWVAVAIALHRGIAMVSIRWRGRRRLADRGERERP
jgi:hypothetical protein